MPRYSVVVIALLLLAACAPPRPVVEWDPDPETIVLQASMCCGFGLDYGLYNNLAEAIIWGDGRIVWVEWSAHFAQRRVLTGQLTPDQLSSLLQQYVAAGFFDWAEHYYPEMPTSDLADQCVQVNLTTATHQVCEYERGAPEDFHRLYDLTTSGAGATGVDYEPTRGYVIAFTADAMWAELQPEAALDWPADVLGVKLAEQAGGRKDDHFSGVWLDGEPLALAWQVVNEHPLKPLVHEGDRYFMLSVLLPDLSMFYQPPPEPE